MSYHEIAIAVIVLVSIVLVFMTVKAKKVIKEAPSFLITVGIAFTFFGIASGLAQFNIDDPSSSLGSLIDGIKTVFWGSFAGVTAALLMRIFNGGFALYLAKKSTPEDEVTKKYLLEHSDIAKLNKHNHDVLVTMNGQLAQNNQHLLEGLNQLGLSFSNNSKNNVQDTLGQILPILQRLEESQNQSHTAVVVDELQILKQFLQGQMLPILERLEISQNQSHTTLLNEEIKNLRVSFDEFAKQQAEQNAQLFIQALEQAIQDFNEQLATQLGENFRELNQAVFKLTTWQENYAEHVEHQTEAYQNMVGYVDVTKDQFNHFAHRAEKFVHVADALDATLGTLAQRQEAIEQHLNTFYHEMQSKAYDVGQLRQHLQDSFDHIKSMHHEHQQQILDLTNSSVQYFTQMTQKQGDFSQRTSREVEQLQQKINQEFSSAQAHLIEQMNMLQKHHENALNTSLQGLARQLASLSAQFTDDYGPITRNLKEIVRMSVRA